MKYGQAHEILKPLEEALLPDPRWEVQAIGSEGNWRKFDISDLHARLRLSVLGPNVPPEIRRQFEIARNLMLYSWFVFEFHIVAEQHAYGALERALREVFPDATRKIRKNGQDTIVSETLAPLLRRARSARLIIPEKLPAWERILHRRHWHEEMMSGAGETLAPMATPEEWFENAIRIIPDFRNKVAHGGFKLYFEASLNALELCFDLITALFGPAHSAPSPT